jgi:RNA polymerase sigma-70 factor (ECF subfamily)
VEHTGDDALMAAVRNGDERKLAVLFERHHGKLYRFYLRMTGNGPWSEDLVQEVFFRMLKYRETYRPEYGFATWMYRIARNAHIDQMRKRKWEVALEPDWDAAAAGGPGPEERQEVEFVRRALLKLPQEKREILVLARFQGMKYEQIAELLECEVGTVKVRVFRAMQLLRETFLEMTGRKAS